MKSFENKLVLITGGSSGIGLALAKKLVEKGSNVAILARRPEVLEQARGEILAGTKNGSKIYTLQADVADETSIKSTLNDFIAQVGVPDLIINSAGVARPGKFEEIPTDIFRWTMDINYFGTVYVCQAIVPHLLKRGYGNIVNISSVAGFLNIYGYTAYGASKFAVRGFSDALRAELKPYGVNVSIVFPPDTDTPQLVFESQFKPDVTRILGSTAGALTADTVADVIIKGIERDRYLILPGLETKILFRLSNFLGGLVHPLMDYLVRDALRKQSKSKK